MRTNTEPISLPVAILHHPFKSLYIRLRESACEVSLGVFGPLELVYSPPLSGGHVPELTRRDLPAPYCYVVERAPIYVLRRLVVLGLAAFPDTGRAGNAATTTA